MRLLERDAIERSLPDRDALWLFFVPLTELYTCTFCTMKAESCATLKTFRILRRLYAFTMQHEWDISSKILSQYADSYWRLTHNHSNALDDGSHNFQSTDYEDALSLSLSLSPFNDRCCPNEEHGQFASVSQQSEKSLIAYNPMYPNEGSSRNEDCLQIRKSSAREELPHELPIHNGWMQRYTSLWDPKQSDTIDTISIQQNLQPLVPLFVTYERDFTLDEAQTTDMLSTLCHQKVYGSKRIFIEPGLDTSCNARSDSYQYHMTPRWQTEQELLQEYDVNTESYRHQNAVRVRMSGTGDHPPSASMQWMPTTWSKCSVNSVGNSMMRKNKTWERDNMHTEASLSLFADSYQSRWPSNSSMKVIRQESVKKSRVKSTFRRCNAPGCAKGARGKSGRCQKHGGGKRCNAIDCTKGAQGSSEYCLFHGGGYRCTVPGCSTGARGTSGLCAKHGGYRKANKTNHAFW